MSHSDNRRRGRLIDRNFQLGLAWRMMLVNGTLLVVALVVVFAPSMYQLATGYRISELEPAAREFLVLHYRVWPAILLIFCGVFAYSLFFSRRIAGPIHRINETLKKMVDGESPGRVPLRRGDYFHDTADLLERLSKKSAGERREGEPKGKNPPGSPST